MVKYGVIIWVKPQKQWKISRNILGFEYSRTMHPDYTLIRSSRRTLSIQIDASARLIVRAPMRMSVVSIEGFLIAKKDWITKHQIKQATTPQRPILSESDTRDAKKKLREYIIPRVHELWDGKNLPKITSIKITKSERRWGSCSAKNWLCFSYRLAEYLEVPPLIRGRDFIDAIIIHELAHLIEKHHQWSFWNLVYSMMPEYEIVMKNQGNLD